MSAVSVLLTENAIVVACDGAAYHPDTGALIGPCTKVIPIVHLNCLITWVGAGSFGTFLREFIGTDFSTFEDLIEALPDLCERVHDTLERVYNWPADATVIVAGWSEQRQAWEAYRIGTWSKQLQNTETGEITMSEPFQADPLVDFWTSTNPGPELMRQFGIETGEQSALDLTAKMVCACRASGGEIGDLNGAYGVGVYLQMTVLQREKITSWIEHRWPDEIGMPIDPNAGEPTPSFPIMMR